MGFTKNAAELVSTINNERKHLESCLEEYLKYYSEYGMDDIGNDFIGVVTYLEQIRLKLEYRVVNRKDETRYV